MLLVSHDILVNERENTRVKCECEYKKLQLMVKTHDQRVSLKESMSFQV